MQMPEALQSRAEQIQYLLYLQSEIPALFEQGAEYDVNFFSLIEDQNHLVAELKKDRDYLRLASRRPPLAEIQINLAENKKTQNRVFDPKALVDAIEAAGLRADENFQSQWDELMSHIVDAQQLQGLMTGIIGLYPAELKAQGFKLKTNLERVEFLRAHPIENSVLRSKFKGEKFGLNADNLKWSEVYKLAELWTRTELELAKHIFVGGSVVEQFDVGREQQSAIDKIRESLLTQFSQKHNGAAIVETVPALRMVEVPPYIGIFRGLVGGDCSTSMTFPFVYMPNERTYFIYSTGGHILGYLQGTLVKAEDRTQFYVHTISGSELSNRHIQLAMHGLAKAAGELGFDKLLLPPKARIYQNINYVSIHNALYPLLMAQEPVAMSYPDGEFREWLLTIKMTNGVGGGYDTEQANPTGHHVKVNNELLTQVQTEVSESKFPTTMKLRRTLTRSDAILAVLDLLAGQQSEVARNTLQNAINEVQDGVNQAQAMNFGLRQQVATQILEPFQITLREDGSLPVHDHLSNSNRYQLQDYYNRVRTVLRGLGVQLSDEMLEKRSYLFNEGHLMAPDALTTDDKAMRKRTVEAVVSLVRRWPKPVSALASIRKNPSLFQDAAPMQKLVLQLARGPVSDYIKLRALKAAGLRFNTMDVKSLTEAVEAKFQEPGLSAEDRKVVMEIWSAITGSRCEGLLRGA
jgi:hypothetical protein